MADNLSPKGKRCGKLIGAGVIAATRFNWLFVLGMTASACFEGWLFSLVLP